MLYSIVINTLHFIYKHVTVTRNQGMYVLIKAMFTKEKIISLELQVEENVSYWNKLVFFFTKENIFFCSKLCKVRLFTFSKK